MKSPHAEREERILSSWKDKDIFHKTLKKNEGRPEFVFFEGPPTANGRPGIHHLEARAFKDAIPRYKTMRGFHVRRKGGWDTHGLPVELQVEKELGLKSKKEIETYGIGAFNEKCKQSVWQYVHEWEDFTNRMGYWVDLKDPYVTYTSSYIESLWNIVQTVDRKDLLYKDYKVVPWCPRCGTGLSSHELAQGYQDVKDLAVTAKFRVKNPEKIGLKGDVFLYAWTTTPWTLPANVALAVNPKISYRIQKWAGKYAIVAKDLSHKYPGPDPQEILGNDLIGLEYEPVFNFYHDFLDANQSSGSKGHERQLESWGRAWKVYGADFVTTETGTGIVHIAPMYGQDDFELATKEGLPKLHNVNNDGTFMEGTDFLTGRFVKEKNEFGKPTVDVDIITDLKKRDLFVDQENHIHSYPFCWRCKTPLIYFARDSWYIKMSALRQDLIRENEGINWEPSHIKEGRFGEWLKEVKDWAISRERYWGTPLPIWICNTCHGKKVVGSIEEITKKSRNEYFCMRHGEAEQNVQNIVSSDPHQHYHLTPRGIEEVLMSARKFKGSVDVIYCSPLARAQETAKLFAQVCKLSESIILTDDRLREMGMGELEGKPVEEFSHIASANGNFFTSTTHGVESRMDIKKRVGAFLEEIESKHQGKRILIVSHDSPLWMLTCAALGATQQESTILKAGRGFFLDNAEIVQINYTILPHNSDYEVDLHRPHIDAVTLPCSCGGTMSRVKEVMDVWFDSGAMPFAQDHYPFDTPKRGLFKRKVFPYPADFISEAIDQTRGWFYTLHAIGVLMGKGKAFKNVICLGHVLDAQGKKMSKSIGNVVNPWDMMDKYGADALRFWMYSVNQPGDSKNFDEKTVDEMVKKVFNLAGNVLTFYQTYAQTSDSKLQTTKTQSRNVLDRWIISRMDQVISTVTSGLDAYKFFESTRAIRDFIADLSQWYLRRSRDRFKAEDAQDKAAAVETTRYILITLAKVMAPFTPFFAEHVYREAGGALESVHLEAWPVAGKVDAKLISDMDIVRSVCSKGLEARMSTKINVRQPLAALHIKKGVVDSLSTELIALVQDEVNVKAVALGASIEKDVELDTAITPALKEEGTIRELMRLIQDLRKAHGLNVGDRAMLTVETDGVGRKLIDTNEAQLKAACGISEVRFGTVAGEPTLLGDIPFKLGL